MEQVRKNSIGMSAILVEDNLGIRSVRKGRFSKYLRCERVLMGLKSASFQCWGHPWYIANDMALYLLSPLLLIPLHSKGKKFLLAIFMLLGLQMLVTMMFVYVNTDDLNHALKTTYHFPVFRAGPWLIGIALGFLHHSMKGNKVEMNRVS